MMTDLRDDETPVSKFMREHPQWPRALARRQLIVGLIYLVFSGAMVAIGNLKVMPAIHLLLRRQEFGDAILLVSRISYFDAVTLAALLAGVFSIGAGVGGLRGLGRPHFERELWERVQVLERRLRAFEGERQPAKAVD